MKWLTDNWDKVLSVFFSVVVSGLVGFFSAVQSTQKEISALQSRITALETLNAVAAPKLQAADDAKLKLAEITKDIDTIKTQNAISTQTNNLLQLLLTEQRQKTINELEELLRKQPKQP